MSVSYTRTNWENRVVQRPRTYIETTNSDGSIAHTPAPGTVAQVGTPLNETNLNNIEEGIVRTVAALNEALETIEAIKTALATYNTRIGNNEREILGVQAVNEDQSANIASTIATLTALSTTVGGMRTTLTNHVDSRDNPHSVTKAQVGLGNVPNVATNDQTPTWLMPRSNAELESGEKLSQALGKTARAIQRLYLHMGDTTNPHAVTKAQVELGNVPNVTTNNQTPTYSVADSDQELVSGETMATAFGKIKRAVARLWAHIADTDNPHNTGIIETAAVDFESDWGKADATGVFTGNGASAGTVTVNGTSCRGQQIDLGFAPSKVVIFVPYTELTLGHSESDLKKYDPMDALCGADMGVVLIGPLLNYYHNSCGSGYRTAAPQKVLSQNHGGAVVYGNGFIVQSYNNADTDTTMRMNVKGKRYTYMAWR